MDQSEYFKLADEALATVAKWLEPLDPDEVDYVTGDGALTMEFADGAKFILSRQAATAQLWLAAQTQAFRFNYDAGQRKWVEEGGGHDLKRRLADLIAAKIGHLVEFPD
jgi:CyaY protein